MDSLRTALSDPNLAYVLLMLSILGISIEILTPGLIFPSTFGIISGIFAFLALSSLPFLMAGMVIVMASVLVFVANRVVTAHRRRVMTGREGFKGSTAIVKTALAPEGLVYFQGELWKATLYSGSAAPGEEVIIKSLEGLKLFVTKERG